MSDYIHKDARFEVPSLGNLSCCTIITSAEDTNYLIFAYETALNVQHTVKTGANDQTARLTVAAEELSRVLTDRVIAKVDTITTPEQAFIQGCILEASTKPLTYIRNVHDKLEHVYDQSLDFHSAVIQEITGKDLLQIDFEHFYHDLTNHLKEILADLNDQLYVISNSIVALAGSTMMLDFTLENCLRGV